MPLFDYDVATNYFGVLLNGLAVTVALTCLVITAAGIFAIPVALGSRSQSAAVRVPIRIFIEIIRGTPLLLQLIYVFYVLPLVGIQFPPFIAATIALTINYTVYMSEVYRSGIDAIPLGQWKAAAAIGMTPTRAFRRIILPQAFRVVTPALGNYFIALFKDTALASVVTVKELMYVGNMVSATSYQYFTIYTLTGLMYLAIGIPVVILVKYLEKRASGPYRRRKAV